MSLFDLFVLTLYILDHAFLFTVLSASFYLLFKDLLGIVRRLKK